MHSLDKMGSFRKKTADCPERASYKKYTEFIDLYQFIHPPRGQFRPGTRHFVVLPAIARRLYNEDYIHESTRYASFVSVNPSTSEWPSKLAEDGYFVDRLTGAMECFCCGNTLEQGHARNCARMNETVPFHHLEEPPDPAPETRVADLEDLNVYLPLPTDDFVVRYFGVHMRSQNGHGQETNRGPTHHHPRGHRAAQSMSRIHADYEGRRRSFHGLIGLQEFASELARQGYYAVNPASVACDFCGAVSAEFAAEAMRAGCPLPHNMGCPFAEQHNGHI